MESKAKTSKVLYVFEVDSFSAYEGSDGELKLLPKKNGGIIFKLGKI